MTDTPPPTGPGPGPTRSPRWMRVALIVSLSANLIVAGLVAGAVLRGPDDRGTRSAGPGGEFRLLARAMPDSQRAALRADMAARRGDFAGRRRALAERRRDLVASLRTDPFDAAAFDAALSAQQEVWHAMGETAHDLLRARVAAMTTAERVRFADNLDAARTRLEARREGARQGN